MNKAITNFKKLAKNVLHAFGRQRAMLKSDLAGYDEIISFLKSNRISSVNGNVLEIGAFTGGGTKKLGAWAATCRKNITVIDIFRIDADSTKTIAGCDMNSLYAKMLDGKDLWSCFIKNTSNLKNLTVIREDSKLVTFDPSVRFCFAFIDGNHDYNYVWSDFELAWHHLSAGGWVGFHDYNNDLPLVTQAIDEITAKHFSQIVKIERVFNRWMIFLQKGTESIQRGENYNA